MGGSRYRKDDESIIWVKGMALGRGAKHDVSFGDRILRSTRGNGSATVEDPMVIWCTPRFQQEQILTPEEEITIRDRS
ncbi:hypothetical protein F4820DRAFT_448892 [Hypoxylon rubiginosum]|uniref:Uncharacterized protein n=1 Tax=Hypoxylon rubiginosum TaxID=110542 RepID=A0ACB9Z044_9PEZI|nr:hypothetical protein F4820DRAFT_448892 [Hypoxylon rubiginosum]